MTKVKLQQWDRDLAEIRYRNFRLFGRIAPNSHLAALMACSQGHTSLLLSRGRRFSADNARGLEKVLGLPLYWMDRPQDVQDIPGLARTRLVQGQSPVAFPDVSGRRGRPRGSSTDAPEERTRKRAEKEAAKNEQTRIREQQRLEREAAKRKEKEAARNELAAIHEQQRLEREATKRNLAEMQAKERTKREQIAAENQRRARALATLIQEIQQRQVSHVLRVDFEISERRLDSARSTIQSLCHQVRNLPSSKISEPLRVARMRSQLEFALRKVEDAQKVFSTLAEVLAAET